MYDRPDVEQLLAAVRAHLEEAVIPAVKGDGKLYFQTLVAANVLRVAERELALRDDHAAAEWLRLDGLDSLILARTIQPQPTNPSDAQHRLRLRNARLCEDIRNGRLDAPRGRTALLEHLLANARAQLQVANPKFLETLAQEDAPPAGG
jgi:hypothetical protein